jgi:transcriptional regulator with XRE-family HTH domain
MQTDQASFGALVAEYRQRRGLSQGQLARAARLSRTYVYHLESGQRSAPSGRVGRALARALTLHGEERRRFVRAYIELTGMHMEDEADRLDLLDQRELAALLVRSSAFPAHSLDRLWHICAWNPASKRLFELDESRLAELDDHLLAVVFDPVYRSHFRPWEDMARRLLADFKYNTRSLTYLPAYRDLWRSLRTRPDFRRIADSADAGGEPMASFVFQMRHSRLGTLTLRTAVTVFTGVSDYSIVTYVPGDQQTLSIYEENGWQARIGPEPDVAATQQTAFEEDLRVRPRGPETTGASAG